MYMDEKHYKKIESVVADLIKIYTDHLDTVQDELEFYTVVTAMLVFKQLAMAEVLESIERDSDEDPSDIKTLLESRAAEIAESVRSRVFSKSLN